MILAIDIGNTSTGLCALETDPRQRYRTLWTCRMQTAREKSETQIGAEMQRLLQTQECENAGFQAAVVSCVVPALLEPVLNCVRRLLGLEAYVITSESDTGLRLAVECPRRLGIDRICDAAGAAALCPLPVVTADLGTATTLNVVDESCSFLGGMICTGVGTGLEALCSHTAQLPRLQPEAPSRLIGKTTEECMLSGAVRGAAAMIDGLTAEVEAFLQHKVSLVLTGGYANLVSDFCRHSHILRPDLLYQGMASIYARSVPDR